MSIFSTFSTRYFEDDEEESGSNVDLPYIPAENSPTRQQMQSGGGSDSEDDPLDAFMAEVEVRRHIQQLNLLLTVSYPHPVVSSLSEPSSKRYEEIRRKGEGEEVSQVRNF